MRPLRATSVLVICAVLLGWTPTAGAQSATGSFEKALDVSLFLDEVIVDGDGDLIGHESGFFGFSSRSGADLGAPGATSTVSGWGYMSVTNFEDPNASFELNFPIQDLGPTAVVSDVAGNTVTVRTPMYTDPQAQTGAHAFDFRLARPTTLFVSHPDSHNPGANAYVDGGTAEARATAYLGVNRSGYTVSGVVADEVMLASPNGCSGTCAYAFANVFDGVVSDPALTIP